MSSSSGETDRLVDRLKDGDRQVLAELFTRYRDRLRRMVAFRLDRRLYGRVSPSDILQETYIDAMQRIEHFVDRPTMPFFLWLRLVAGQRLIDVHRRHLGAQKRDAGQEVSLRRRGGAHETSICLAAGLAAHLTSPSQASLKSEMLAQLEKAIDTMDAIDREILALRHFEELSNNETAEVLEITKAAASKRYVRALKRLRKVLAAVPGFSDDAR